MAMQVLSSLQSLALIRNIPQCGLLKKPLICGQALRLSSNERCPNIRTFKPINFRVFASGTEKSSSKAVETTSSNVAGKDGDLVFVAGATGRVGSRTVREILKLGFRVRAGVRSSQRAESLMQSVQEMKLDGATSGLVQPIERLEIVECDLEKKDQIAQGLGNSSIVICCIGASEKEIFDVTGPYRIDYQATKNLVDAATIAKIDHFILVTSLGTNKVGFPAAILNLFWGVLVWKRKAEEALLASGLPYTIVRPGGMERPTDAFKETHNITLSQEDTLFGGLVSNLQVAELMAFMAANRSLSYCKVVEVIAATTAPLTPTGELLAKIPSQRADLYTSKDLGDVDRQPAVPAEKEPAQIEATTTTPLSPYTAYEDLKPPTSPTPTPSTGSLAINESGAGKINSATNSSPSSLGVSSLELSNTSKETISTEKEGKKISASSSYTSYEILKTPTTPTPNPPSGAIKDSTITGAVSRDTTADSEASQTTRTAATPLSPYTAYDNLKPPTSPSPSAPAPSTSRI